MYCYGTAGEAAKESLCMTMVKREGPARLCGQERVRYDTPLLSGSIGGCHTGWFETLTSPLM